MLLSVRVMCPVLLCVCLSVWHVVFFSVVMVVILGQGLYCYCMLSLGSDQLKTPDMRSILNSDPNCFVFIAILANSQLIQNVQYSLLAGPVQIAQLCHLRTF